MLNSLVDICVLLLLKFSSFIIRLLPKNIVHLTLYFITKLALALRPSYKNIAIQNINIAFPTIAQDERDKLIDQHCWHLARFTRDCLTLPWLDPKWAIENVDFPDRSIQQLIKDSANTGSIIATGHLGSFELHAQVSSIFGFPLSFVVRNFSHKLTDAWWCKVRERMGNSVIQRQGAYRQIVKTLRSGRDVGILFDQNVTKEHAVFVPWFGLDAATTRAVALAALSTKAPIIVSALCYAGNGRYEWVFKRCTAEQYYDNNELSKEEKIYQITLQATEDFVELIKRYPSQWFWLHRRWKTRPDGGKYQY